MVDFEDTTIITTTNLGIKDIVKGAIIEFQLDGDMTTPYERMRSHVNGALKEHFRPELLNRAGDTIILPQLQREEIPRTVDLMVGKLGQRLAK